MGWCGHSDKGRRDELTFAWKDGKDLEPMEDGDIGGHEDGEHQVGQVKEGGRRCVKEEHYGKGDAVGTDEVEERARLLNHLRRRRRRVGDLAPRERQLQVDYRS